jgi:hypothetical protein
MVPFLDLFNCQRAGKEKGDLSFLLPPLCTFKFLFRESLPHTQRLIFGKIRKRDIIPILLRIKIHMSRFNDRYIILDILLDLISHFLFHVIESGSARRTVISQCVYQYIGCSGVKSTKKCAGRVVFLREGHLGA